MVLPGEVGPCRLALLTPTSIVRDVPPPTFHPKEYRSSRIEPHVWCGSLDSTVRFFTIFNRLDVIN